MNMEFWTVICQNKADFRQVIKNEGIKIGKIDLTSIPE